MKILDYTNKEFTKLELRDNTAMIMCFQPKIVLFETSSEMNKFKRVWEDVIQSYLNEKEIDLDGFLDYYAGYFVDCFEEESWLKSELEDGIEAVKARNLIIVDNTKACDSTYSDSYEIRFGVLNSKDEWIDMNTLEVHIKLVEMLFNIDKLKNRLKDDTIEIFKNILNIWKEELRLSQDVNKKYFKVRVIGD